MPPDALFRFGICSDYVVVVAPPDQPLWHAMYADLEAADVQGAGAVRSGGGFIGGGFDVEGAAVGMLIGTALNALTTRTRVESVLRLVTRHGEAYFAFTETLPQQISVELSRYRTWRRQAARDDNTAAAAHDIVTLLERLANLHSAGHLNDAEYAAQKAALLGS
jgi:hypothetical protein